MPWPIVMMKFNRIILIFLLSLLPFQLHSEEDNTLSGLFFHSFEVDKDNRTSLNLTPEKKLHAPEGFSIDFEIKLRVEVQCFGYVFRTIGNDTLDINLIAYQFDPVSVFTLVAKKKELIHFSMDEVGEEGINSEWIDISFGIDTQSDKVFLEVKGTRKEADYPLNGIDNYEILFGKNDHIDFYTTDVAPISIRNIKLFDSNENIILNWKLKKHGIDDSVYDECKNQKALVENPSWEIDKHVNWQKKKTFSLPGGFYQFAYDNLNNRIFIVRDQKVIVYQPSSNTADTLWIEKGYPYNSDELNLAYDPVHDELISYHTEKNKLARFNFQTKEWSNEDNNHLNALFSHHGRYYNPSDSTLIIFGGYGIHRYYSTVRTLSPDFNDWNVVDLKQEIQPRYLGSFGMLDDSHFLYFGGYGNESGIQQQGTYNHYDLFKVNLKDYSVEKIWELPSVSEHFTNSNSMVIDTVKGVFYTLSYPNNRHSSQIVLNEFQLKEPEFRTLGDSLPFLFNDVGSYCDLYQSSNGENLYALLSYLKDDNSEISVYSISYPPLSYDEIIQIEEENASNKYLYLLIIPACLLISAYVFYFLNKRKKQNKIDKELESDIDFTDVNNIIPTQLPSSSIHLLINFKLIDRDGNEIKENFSPTTQQVFLIILLFTIKNGNGITSDELNKYFWEDKDSISARNSRNVYINKVRSILKQVDGINLTKEKGYWKIDIDKDIYCDYLWAISLINTIKSQTEKKENLLNELLGILSQGPLLPYIQADRLDNFKADFSFLVIDTLSRISKKKEWDLSYNTLLKIANVILLHDSTDEYGIKLKCHILLKEKKNAQAKQAYQKYAAAYERLLAVKPNFTLEDIQKSGVIDPE